MEMPNVFVMRNDWRIKGTTPPNYMSEANWHMLEAFAEVTRMGGSKDAPMDRDALIGQLQGTRVILNLNGSGSAELTEEVMRAVPSLEAVVTAHSACWGSPSLSAAAKNCGLKAVEGSNSIDMSVAEWTVGCAIMGRRRMLEGCHNLRDRGIWQHDWEKEGILYTSTVGLFGLGRIGRLVAHYLRTLGAKVIAYDKYFDENEAKKIGVELTGIDDLLQRADVISLHMPVTNETRGTLKAREFAMIKDGAVLINCARAALYDEEALVAELRKRRFSAFIDVYSLEGTGNLVAPYVSPADKFRSPYQPLENVFLTSHSAGTNQAMYERAGAESIETIRLYFEGEGLRDLRDVRF